MFTTSPPDSHIMCVLSDRDIKQALHHGKLGIKPFDIEALQPSSVDLKLGREFRIFNHIVIPYIDVSIQSPDEYSSVKVATENEPFIIHPGTFCLGSTVEEVSLDDSLVGRLDGRSSLGRLGLLIHATAGYIDPGFTGKITLEISNLSPVPIAVWPGMRICQISFLKLVTNAEKPYSGKYQGHQDPTASRIYEDFNIK